MTGRNAELLFDSREQGSMTLHHLRAARKPRRHHAAGELLEALAEYALTPVARKYGNVIGNAVERRNPSRGDALRRRLTFYRFDPARKGRRIIAR
jgi:hypothetical protein